MAPFLMVILIVGMVGIVFSTSWFALRPALNSPTEIQLDPQQMPQDLQPPQEEPATAPIDPGSDVDPPGTIRVRPDVAETLLVSKVAPTYPALARQAHIQGSVLLKVRIARNGTVEFVKLISGHPTLDPLLLRP